MVFSAAMEPWTSLLETAVHAPSPHNVQPWKICVVNDNQAELFIDSGRTLPKEDVTGSFIILTMGMFIEALSVVAASRGLQLEYELSHEPDWFAPAILNADKKSLLPFARLRLTAHDGVNTSYDPNLFLRRRTSRISLLPTPIPDQSEWKLKELAHEWQQRYEQITDPSSIEAILAKNAEALFEDLNHPGYHDEIVEWFRFTDRQSRKHRDGLDYRCMNSSRTAFWLVARFPRLLQIRLTRPLLWKQYRSQLGTVPTIGMLAGRFWEPDAAIRTGRFLMRFWLETARLGLYIHPYGNLVTNKAAADWLQKESGVADIWLVFKIGFSPEPPLSYRRSVEEILV